MNIYSNYNIDILPDIIREHRRELDLLQFSQDIFCINITSLLAARGQHPKQPLNNTSEQQLNKRYSYKTYCEENCKFNFK